jgi:hypothetical protein
MTLLQKIKDAMYGMVLAGSITAGGYLYGIDGLSNAVAFSAGEAVARGIEGKKITLESLANQAAAGVIMTPVFQYGWDQMERYFPAQRISLDSHVMPQLGKNVAEYSRRTAVIGTAFLPAVVGIHQSVDYLLEEKNVTGLYGYLKVRYWPVLKKVMLQVTPLVALNTFLVPVGLNIAVGAFISAAYRVVMSVGSRAVHHNPAYQLA